MGCIGKGELIKMEAGVLMVVLVVVMAFVAVARAEVIKVGDKGIWDESTNYTEWSSRHHFYVHNWLLFNFNKYQYDVLEVNKTNYENCNPQNFITNITKGGRDVFELKEARPYYFICSKGSCWGGMKLAINVEEVPAPAPAPSGTSSLNISTHHFLFLMVFYVLCLVL